MNIEEILHKLEIVARKHTIEVCDGSKIETMPASLVDELRLNYFSAELLSNYIDNKEKEINRLNNIIDELEKWIKENNLGKYRTENVVNTDELLDKLNELKEVISNMNIEKIYMHKEFLQKALTFEEISKLYREVLYNQYEELTDSDSIHCYQLTRDIIDIFTQMVNGRKFEENYLKNKIKW